MSDLKKLLISTFRVEDDPFDFDFRGAELRKVSHQPHLGELSYRHTFYAPPSPDALERFVGKDETPFPRELVELYGIVGGFEAFDHHFVLYGVPTHGRMHEPFSLRMVNGPERPRDLTVAEFAFATFTTGLYTNGVLYHDTKARHIHLSMDRWAKRPVRSWSSLPDCVAFLGDVSRRFFPPGRPDVDYAALGAALRE